MLFAFPSENMEGLDFKLFVYSRKALRQSRYDSKVWDGGGGQPDGVVISYLIFGMRQGMEAKRQVFGRRFPLEKSQVQILRNVNR